MSYDGAPLAGNSYARSTGWMFDPQTYQLLDFGDGRRLERFGPLRLDRPCPSADRVARADPSAWRQADSRFNRTDAKTGDWTSNGHLPERWSIQHGPITFELKRTEFGHLGLFPEQAANWDWIARQVYACSTRPKVLNLFAYTGGSTLAAAAAGAEVTHLDSAKNVVAWARRNAELSGMSDAPIHWVVEDAMKFVTRELKRENRYDAVVLDPPSYGHGCRGEVWRLATDLPRLLGMCAELTAERRRFVLLTAHTPKFSPKRLKQILSDALGDDEPGTASLQQLVIPAAAGRKLPCGVAVRWAQTTANRQHDDTRS